MQLQIIFKQYFVEGELNLSKYLFCNINNLRKYCCDILHSLKQITLTITVHVQIHAYM